MSAKIRGGLIAVVFGLLAIIVFGLLWFFFLSSSNPTGFGWYLFSFAAGLSMIVLPCTLPLAFVIVPLSMGKGVVKGLGMAIFFGAGVAVMLSIYGIVAALVGQVAIGSIGAPLESIKNWVYFIAGIFALIFALAEIGLLKWKMPTYSGAAPSFIQKKQDFLKAFLLGLFLGNIGVGCPHPATPLILIEIASSGQVLYGWLLFLVHAIGRILPLLFLAFLGVLGVNGLSWLVARKDKVEKITGWGMVFVAGFILTLGLFTHDWWVNSGIHTQFEKITFEKQFLGQVAENLDSEIVHGHQAEIGVGLFGLPLALGNWVLVGLWIAPIWWWWFRKRNNLINNISAAPPSDAILCEKADLSNKKYIIILLTLLLGFAFVYYLPHNFLKHEALEIGHGENADSAMGGLTGETFEQLPYGSKVVPTEMVVLKDGDTFDLTATIVEKNVGNRKVKMLAYNAMIPGPIIRVDQGSEININFTNLTDIETTIHSHGIRIDNRFDGVAFMTQDPVGIGESFQYKVKFPDAGVYWYHPHIREDYAQEQGLYGNYIVESADINYWSKVNREIPLMVDDIKLKEGLIEEFYKKFTNYALLGRFGNTFLVNGEVDPTIDIVEGSVVRLPITNVSNTRTYRLSIPGARMKIVGADIGKYENEWFADDFLILPAERVIVEVYFEKSGTYDLVHKSSEKMAKLAKFNVKSEDPISDYSEVFNIARRNSDVISEVSRLRSYIPMEPDKKLKLTVNITDIVIDHDAHAHEGEAEALDRVMENMDSPDNSEHAHGTGATGEDAIQWDDITGDTLSTSDNVIWKLVDEATGLENMEIDWIFKVGDLVKVRLENDAEAEHVMQHPIHFHGQRFVVLAQNGVPNTNMVWKDTVLVLPGETTDILVDMSNPGVWMSHCHIAEHLHAGMMFGFRVEDASGKAPGDEYRAAVNLRATSAISGNEHESMSMKKEVKEDDSSHASPNDEAPLKDDIRESDFVGHMHDDGEVHAHQRQAPIGWWPLLIISLALISVLSFGVHKFLAERK